MAYVDPRASLRELMREDDFEFISDPWTLAAPAIFRDWARVVSFLTSRAWAIRHWRTASAQLSFIAPVNFDSDEEFLLLPDFPAPWKQNRIVYWVSFQVLMCNDNECGLNWWLTWREEMHLTLSFVVTVESRWITQILRYIGAGDSLWKTRRRTY